MFKKHVSYPMNLNELNDCARECTLAGFPGCIGSTDASHMTIENCEHRLQQLHLGHELSYAARTCNITTNHRRKTLHATSGHSTRFNDKTLVLFDNLILKLKDRNYNQMFQFELMDHDEDENIVKIKHNGCHVILDNGYLSWSIAVPPLKTQQHD